MNRYLTLFSDLLLYLAIDYYYPNDTYVAGGAGGDGVSMRHRLPAREKVFDLHSNGESSIAQAQNST